MSGKRFLPLNRAGMKGHPNAGGVEMKGTCCGRGEATAGSCASLLGPVDVSWDHWCSPHQLDVQVPAAPLAAALIQLCFQRGLVVSRTDPSLQPPVTLS